MMNDYSNIKLTIDSANVEPFDIDEYNRNRPINTWLPLIGPHNRPDKNGNTELAAAPPVGFVIEVGFSAETAGLYRIVPLKPIDNEQ